MFNVELRAGRRSLKTREALPNTQAPQVLTFTKSGTEIKILLMYTHITSRRVKYELTHIDNRSLVVVVDLSRFGTNLEVPPDVPAGC